MNMNICTYLYLYSTSPHEMRRKVNFQAEFNRFEFRVFPSPRLVTIPRLKNPFCHTIYSKLQGE